MGGLADPGVCQHVSVRVIDLTLIGQARLPEHVLELVQKLPALLLGNESVHNDDRLARILRRQGGVGHQHRPAHSRSDPIATHRRQTVRKRKDANRRPGVSDGKDMLPFRADGGHTLSRRSAQVKNCRQRRRACQCPSPAPPPAPGVVDTCERGWDTDCAITVRPERAGSAVSRQGSQGGLMGFARPRWGRHRLPTLVVAVVALALVVPALARADNVTNMTWHNGTIMPSSTTYAIFWLPAGRGGRPESAPSTSSSPATRSRASRRTAASRPPTTAPTTRTTTRAEATPSSGRTCRTRAA